MRPRLPDELVEDIYNAAEDETPVDPRELKLRHSIRAIVDQYEEQKELIKETGMTRV